MLVESKPLILTDSLPDELIDRVSIIDHFGKQILFMDLSDMSNRTDDILQVMSYHAQLTMNLDSEHVRHLVYGKGSKMNDQIKGLGKELMKMYKSHDIKITSAIMGITGLQRIIARAVQPKFYFAASKEDALNWLASK